MNGLMSVRKVFCMASDGVDPVGLSKRTNKVSKALAPLTVTKRLAANQ